MEKKTLWILEDHFSQNWHINIECIESHIRGQRIMCNNVEYFDHLMTDIVGNEIADYGYILLQADDRNDDNIIVGCRTKEDFDLAYSRICDAIINHPHCIDFRGIDLIFG